MIYFFFIFPGVTLKQKCCRIENKSLYGYENKISFTFCKESSISIPYNTRWKERNLEWSTQIETLVSKLKKRLSGLESLKYIMSSPSKKVIVDGLFNSVLCYCLPLFGGYLLSEQNSLEVQQNKAVQIVLSLPPGPTVTTCMTSFIYL